MRSPRLIAAVIALATVAAVAAEASAYYHPTIGRFVSRDPGPGTRSAGQPQTADFLPRDPTGSNQYADGMNLYQYVRSSPAGHVDPSGKNLYAIGGTQEVYTDNANVAKFHDLYVGDNGAGNTKYYWNGPGTGRLKLFNSVTGADAGGIFRGVMSRICSDYSANKSVSINLVGWSRGATVALEVGEELQDDGCCVNGKVEKNIPVNWIGLFDHVDMTTAWGYAYNATSNVKHVSHAVKTGNAGLTNPYPTTKVRAENAKNTSLVTMPFLRTRDREKVTTDHGDIGRRDEVLQWMIAIAESKGGLKFARKGMAELAKRIKKIKDNKKAPFVYALEGAYRKRYDKKYEEYREAWLMAANAPRPIGVRNLTLPTFYEWLPHHPIKID